VQDLIAKAGTLLEALPYIQKFNGATFVVKYGGSFMDSPDANVRQSVARDIVFLPSSSTAAARPSPARWKEPD
jgi:acetylglutamate kinase